MRENLLLRKALFVFITLSLILLQSSFLSANQIRFISVDYPTATRMSTEQGKYFFVNYSADWCPTCSVMEETANAYPDLLDYISRNFIAIKANVDEPIGKEWQNQYDISCLPTLIVFSPDGQEVTRAGGGLTASQFLKLLQTIEMPSNAYAAQGGNAGNGFSQNSSSNPNGIGNNGNSPSRNVNTKPNNSSVALNDFANSNNDLSANASPSNPPNENYNNQDTDGNNTNHSANFSQNNSFENSNSNVANHSNGVNDNSNFSQNQSSGNGNGIKTGNGNNESYSGFSNNNSTNQYSQNGNIINATANTGQNNSNGFSSKGGNGYANNASNNTSSFNGNYNSNGTTSFGSNCSAFGVQVGMYSNENNANRKTERMKRKLGQPVFIQQQMVKGELLYQVVVGEYVDLQEAIRFQKTLNRKGIKGYLIQM